MFVMADINYVSIGIINGKVKFIQIQVPDILPTQSPSPNIT